MRVSSLPLPHPLTYCIQHSFSGKLSACWPRNVSLVAAMTTHSPGQGMKQTCIAYCQVFRFIYICACKLVHQTCFWRQNKLWQTKYSPLADYNLTCLLGSSITSTVQYIQYNKSINWADLHIICLQERTTLCMPHNLRLTGISSMSARHDVLPLGVLVLCQW